MAAATPRSPSEEAAHGEDVEVQVRKLRVRSKDGAESDMAVFVAAHGSPRALVVCTSAIGVGAHHYEPLARELARSGFCACTTDLRGVGSSSVRASRSINFGYLELVSYDLPAAIAVARDAYPTLDLLLLGHSLGAHISAMHASVNPRDARGLILVAAGTSYFKSWAFPQNVAMLGVAHVTRSVSAVLGYFPGRSFGFFGTEARQLMREWSILTTRGRFEVRGSPHDFETRLAEVDAPVLALSFPGDIFAPKNAVEHLLSKMPRATVSHRRVEPSELGARSLDHFRWAKYPAPIADLIVRWILETPGVLAQSAG